MEKDRLQEAADRVAEALKTHLPEEGRHDVLESFALVRYTAESAQKLRERSDDPFSYENYDKEIGEQDWSS
jgi:hypothetical protein